MTSQRLGLGQWVRPGRWGHWCWTWCRVREKWNVYDQMDLQSSKIYEHVYSQKCRQKQKNTKTQEIYTKHTNGTKVTKMLKSLSKFSLGFSSHTDSIIGIPWIHQHTTPKWKFVHMPMQTWDWKVIYILQWCTCLEGWLTLSFSGKFRPNVQCS